MESDAYSMRARNAATPSRRAMGPEKSNNALRAGRRTAGVRVVGPDRPGSVCGAVGGVSLIGKPGGCDASPSECCAMDCGGAESVRQGKESSLKYTSEVVTTFPVDGTHTSARLDGESTAAERQDAHDAWTLADEQFVRRRIGFRRARGAVKYVDGLQRGVVPEGNGRTARNEGSAA
eukprot:97043-Pleurochrysis_carterae.AAC.2